MTAKDMIETIESPRLRAELRLASTTRSLLARLAEDEGIRCVMATMTLQTADCLVKRAEDLLSVPAPQGYSHPADLALSAYAFVLDSRAAYAARRLLDRLGGSYRPELPSATCMARYVLDRSASTTTSGSPKMRALDALTLVPCEPRPVALASELKDAIAQLVTLHRNPAQSSRVWV
jgi:hypothetical protein